MLTREDIRKILLARDKVNSRYIENNIEDVTTKQLCEDILLEVEKITKVETRNTKK